MTPDLEVRLVKKRRSDLMLALGEHLTHCSDFARSVPQLNQRLREETSSCGHATSEELKSLVRKSTAFKT
jgi:hypothetical protein